MSNLVPEVRVNKNGVAVTKHVLPQNSAKSASSIPAPAAVSGVYQPLPALKGKVLKEAKEILRLSANGDQEYEDAVTGAFLGNDIRSMRILSGVTDNGESAYTERALNIIEARIRVGLGNDEEPDAYVAKCKKYLEMADGKGPLNPDDFLSPEIMGDESGKIMQWLESNWDDVDEIMDFFHDRPMQEYSAAEHESTWKDYKSFPAKSLFEGYI